MFLPIGDTPNPQRYTPVVTWSLMAINVAVYLFVSLPLSSTAVDSTEPLLGEYLRALAPGRLDGVGLREILASISRYDIFLFAHGYKSAAPEVGDLFASLFLHGGFWHLAGNMLFLWIFGDNVEHRLGRVGFALAYLGTGVVATLAFAAADGPSLTPLVGASGAISGVLGLYFLLFKRNRVKVLIVLFPFYVDVLLLPARWVLGFFVLVDNLVPFLFGSASGVAYGAHLGGFAGGLLIAYAGEALSWRWPWRDAHWRVGSAVGRRRPRPAPATSEAAAVTLGAALSQAVLRGDRAKAIALVPELDLGTVAELTPQQCVVLAGWLDQAGHPMVAGNLLRRCLGSHRRDSSLAPVYLALGLQRLAHGQATAAYQHLLAVFDHQPDAETAARAQEALASIATHGRKRS